MSQLTQKGNTMERLMSILSLKRGHCSVGEQMFIDTFLADYPHNTYRDEGGEALAYVIIVGESRTLFSCHIDTVHAASEGPTNNAIYDEACGLAYKEDDSPLGADDGAGVWLMLEMIDYGVPGTYVFHRGEERGGIGSWGMAATYADWLRSFDRAVAFDRRGTTDVITHQGGGRCCSDAFATALANRLNQFGLLMRPSDQGIYTDTAEYVSLIPECTNISVGYDREHTKYETLDTMFLHDLRIAVLGIDWETLPTMRNPDAIKASASWWETSWRDTSGAAGTPQDEFDLAGMDYDDVYTWARDGDPGEVADMLVYLADKLARAYPSDTTGMEDDYVN